MKTDTVIKGRQISLSTCLSKDIDNGYVNGLNDKEVNQYLETRFSIQTPEAVREYVDAMERSENDILFAIRDLKSGRHIGNVHIRKNMMHNTATIAYLIWEKDLWGKGMGTEAVMLATDWGFEELGLDRMEAGYYKDNAGSEGILRKAGYETEGVSRSAVILDDGTRSDVIHVALLREDHMKGKSGV